MPRAPPNQHLSSASTFSSTLDNSTCCVLETCSETRDVAFVNSIARVDNVRLGYGKRNNTVMKSTMWQKALLYKIMIFCDKKNFLNNYDFVYDTNGRVFS